MRTQAMVAIVAALLAAAVATSAVAQQSCTRNGQTYPDGTQIGDLRCENGQWVVVQ